MIQITELLQEIKKKATYLDLKDRNFSVHQTR